MTDMLEPRAGDVVLEVGTGCGYQAAVLAELVAKVYSIEVVRELAAAESRGVIVCPAGFVSDHLEILYDLDVECRTLAQDLGIAWRRTRSPNADPAFLRVLTDVVLDRLSLSAL